MSLSNTIGSTLHSVQQENGKIIEGQYEKKKLFKQEEKTPEQKVFNPIGMRTGMKNSDWNIQK